LNDSVQPSVSQKKRALKLVNRTAIRVLNRKPIDEETFTSTLRCIATIPWKGTERTKVRNAANLIRKGTVIALDPELKSEIKRLARSRGNQRLFRGII